jgi:prepilin-type N-terminal cleavage/methylation domain-containing protein
MKTCGGYSLIEMCVALALISVVFLATLSLLPGAYSSFKRSEHRMAANAVAQEIIDHCCSEGFSSLQPGSWDSTSAIPIAVYLADQTLEDQTVLKSQLLIEPGAGAVSDQLRLVTLTIRWNERESNQTLVRHRRIANLQR